MLVRPDNWSFFTQPSGMSEKTDKDGLVEAYVPNNKAENRSNLTENYYPNIIKGKTKGWIDVYVMNKLGSLEEGKPVYPSFKEEIHVSREPIPIAPVQVYVGLDFGLTPAAVFGQRLSTGRWQIVHELVCFDMGAGEGKTLIAGNRKQGSFKAKTGFDVFPNKKRRSAWDFLRKSG